MGNTQTILVPQASSFPGVQKNARLILNWLSALKVVQREASHCVPNPLNQGYARGERADWILAGDVIWPSAANPELRDGLEIITDRCIYTPEVGFQRRAQCPECRKAVGEALFEHLEQWMPAETDNFICPVCGFEDDINGFRFPQPCGFSDLGFIFHNWPDAEFSPTFLREFRERLGFPISIVKVICADKKTSA